MAMAHLDHRYLIGRVLEWAEVPVNSVLLERLEVFVAWLATEAAAAGGIGPGEADRLWPRHVGDSLTYAAAIRHSSSVVDVGSGVGLPAIPLAITLPDVHFLLLDRAERRCRLARRAIRVLELGNVEVVQGDAHRLSVDSAAVVTRATFPPDQFFELAPLLAPDAKLAVTASSHGATPPEAVAGRQIIAVPPELLGRETWLIMVSLSD